MNTKYRFLINACRIIAGISACVLFLALSSCAAPARSKLILEAKEATQSTDTFMGDWQGGSVSHDGTKSPLVAQVIALGDGKYKANLLRGFNKRIAAVQVLEGQLRADGTVQFAAAAEKGKRRSTASGAISHGKFTGTLDGSMGPSFSMHQVYRLSPTFAARPPSGAVVLFDGTNLDHWQHAKKPGPVQWKLVNGAMEIKPGTGSIITKRKFTDFKLHLEFRTPFMPEARGQGRGNSGVYLQGRYEVQVLDSYGLEGRDNECGGIYKVAVPRVNMCAPPLQWQTYDITFHAPRFDSTGKKIANARLTVLHNGVEIHHDVEVPGPTAAALDSNVTGPGGIYLQDHGNPVQYRNIWLVELH